MRQLYLLSEFEDLDEFLIIFLTFVSDEMFSSLHMQSLLHVMEEKLVNLDIGVLL